MNKLKLFIENFLVYGLGGIISKIIPLIMVPIITRLMPDTSYYGISDMSNTVVSFGSAFAVMGMYDAMYRLFFDKDDKEYKKSICSTAFCFTLITSIVIFILMVTFKSTIAKLFFGNQQYANLVYITAIATLAGATNNIVAAPTRMQNKRKLYLIMNTFTPILSYSVAVPLLLSNQYVIALPVAGMVASIAGELVFIILNKEWFDMKKVDFTLLKSLLKLGIPLLPNFLIYWIFNSSDKLMLTNIMGTAATGIYSVGSKLGHASQLIYTAFAGGWQYFSFSTMKESNQITSNSRIFEYLGIISFICSMGIFALSKPIYEFLFTGEYISGYIISPYLFLAPLLQMLFQVACNQFIVIKKTWPNMFILAIGAMVNILLNFYLIPLIGIEGAAIATLMGYTVSVIICVFALWKMKLMVIRIRFIISSVILVMFIFLWRYVIGENVFVSLITTIIFSLIYIVLYKSDIKKLMNILKKTTHS